VEYCRELVPSGVSSNGVSNVTEVTISPTVEVSSVGFNQGAPRSPAENVTEVGRRLKGTWHGCNNHARENSGGVEFIYSVDAPQHQMR
jgi:hypothetical protein